MKKKEWIKSIYAQKYTKVSIANTREFKKKQTKEKERETNTIHKKITKTSAN